MAHRVLASTSLGRALLLASLVLAPPLGGCAGDGASAPGDTPGVPSDVPAPLDTVGDLPGDSAGPMASCPDGQVLLTFAIDDRANATYAQGDLIWTGSFAHDAATNTLTYATSWLPEEGPYPVLFDDGPIDAGGHEPPGAVAGDHIWGVAVCYVADEDRVLSYGLLNSDLRWLWVGPNGQLELAAGAAGPIEVPGQAMVPHGDRDFRVFLNMNALHPDYDGISLDTHEIWVKGTMNSWTPIQLLDNGTLGDETAGDGLVSYQHSSFLGPHDGLLRAGQEAQFVFVFTQPETDPDAGLEYKIDGNAAPDGVTAEGECDAGWQPLDVALTLDSKGVAENTAIVMCPDDPSDDECGDGFPCPDGGLCLLGVCVGDTTPEGCGDGPACSSGESCVDGACVPDVVAECGPELPCGEGEICVGGTCVPDTGAECDDATPCPEGETCVAGACVPEVIAECGPDTPCPGDQICVGGACIEVSAAPELFFILPTTGPSTGGTEVSLLGEGFEEGTTVTFGAADATVTATEPTEMTAVTPAGPLGQVDVVVTRPDGTSAVFPGGFTYVEAGSAPTIASVSPDNGPSAGGTTVTLSGSTFAPDAAVFFGTQEALDVSVAVGGVSLTAVSPAAPVGTVDVIVQNPDGQKATAVGAFTYGADTPTWGQLDGPAAVDTVAGKASPTLTAQVYHGGVTDASPSAPGAAMAAEIGYGPVGSDPTDSDAWTWSQASYSQDLGNNDVFSGKVSPPVGTWAATFRFSINGGIAWLYTDLTGADDGFQAGELAAVTVGESGPVVALSVAPSSTWVGGGETVSLTGDGFSASCSLSVDGVQVDSSFESDTELTFTAPPHPSGAAAVVVTCDDGSDTTELVYAGAIDGALGEWPATTEVATNSIVSDWGDDNALSALHVATDGVALLIGITGRAMGAEFGPNAIAVFVDTEYGDGNGLAAMSGLTDSDGEVEGSLGGAATFSAAGFGADLGFATLNMASYTPDVVDPGSVPAGWRGFTPADDAPWLLDGWVVSGASSVEAALPLETLFGGPPTGATRTLGFVVRVTNASGDYFPNQALPEGAGGSAYEDAEGAATFTLVY